MNHRRELRYYHLVGEGCLLRQGERRELRRSGGVMRIFYGLSNLPKFRRPAVSVGSYDGVHRGHRAMIDFLTAAAKANDGESIILTFDPHPRIALRGDDDLLLLTTLDEKLALFSLPEELYQNDH